MGPPARGWATTRRETGARRWRSYRTKAEAELALADVLREAGQAAVATVDPKISFGAYSTLWLERVQPVLKPATHRSYKGVLERDVPAPWKTLRVRQVTRGHIRELLTAKLGEGLARNSMWVSMPYK